MNQRPSHKHATHVTVSLLALLVFLSCSFFNRAISPVPETGGAAAQATETLTEQTPVTQAGQTELALEAALPRSFQYKGLSFSLQRATILTQPPEGIAPSANEAAYAQTVWQISNPTTDTVYINQGVVTLRLSDETTATQPYDDIFQSQDTRDVTFVFTLPPTATWDNTQITFTEPDKEPATLPLQGAVPPAKYPQQLTTTGGEVEVKDPPLTYQIQEAAVDLDGIGERADQGKLFLLFKIETTCKGQYDCYVGPESFRIIADETPYSAQRIEPAAEAVEPDSSHVFRLAFQIPNTAAQLALQVGEADKDSVRIPLDLPAGQ